MTRNAPSTSGKLPPLKAWLFATRFWSLTAAFVPLALGSLLAVAQGYPLLWGRFVLILVTGCLIQVATNFLNAYGDFKQGVDTPDYNFGQSQIALGNLPADALYRAGVATLGIAALLGIWLIVMCGWPLAVFGALGLAGAYGYTTGPAYKFRALGLVAVFCLMGPLMVMPAYFAQTGTLSLMSLLAGFPIAFLVTAIMHANDVRDIAHDRAAGIRTVGLLLGRDGGLRLQTRLFAGAFLTTAIVGFEQPAFFLPLMLVPLAIRILKPAFRDDAALRVLDVNTAKLHLLFGLTTLAGLILSAYLRG